jgi:hypothetical protein
MVATAYDRYSIDDDATNCRQCHGDFRSGSYVSPVDGLDWGNLHNIHRSTMLSGDCDVCHIGNNRLPVMIAESDGGDGFEPVSCMGCHGVDPAPDVPDNSWWGAGLRAHHTNALPTRTTPASRQTPATRHRASRRTLPVRLSVSTTTATCSTTMPTLTVGRPQLRPPLRQTPQYRQLPLRPRPP